MNQQITLKDGPEEFTVSLYRGPAPSRTVLFAVGGGGDPCRHAALLNLLAEQGCTVVAPHFERLTSHLVSAPSMALRMRRIRLALEHASCPAQAIYGVGHSIGATVLIGLAGGQIWMHDGKQLNVETSPCMERMVLFTPATQFFTAPGALRQVRTPIQAWAGTLDKMTPPSQTRFLQDTLGTLVDARYIEGAGHFSFMNELPPNVVDTLPEREPFLAQLHLEVSKFLFDGNTWGDIRS